MHLSFTFSQLVVSGVYAVHKEFDNRAAGNRVVVGRCRCGANSGPYGNTCRRGAVAIIGIGATINVRI